MSDTYADVTGSVTLPPADQTMADDSNFFRTRMRQVRTFEYL